MGRAFVCFILAVLLIAVHSSMAFPSNIHEKMSRVERSAVFGSEDSVPEYEVFPISLPGARQRRKADENINLKLDIYGQKIELNLKPTMRYLATKYTPVWLAESDKHADKNIRYEPLPTAMSDIGKFKMYHDVENVAAVTVYEDPAEGSVLEGIFDNAFIIRSLPKRLMGELLKVEGYTEEGKGYYAVFKIPAAPKDVKNSSLVDQDNLLREKRARYMRGKRKVPKAVYPEILIVVDYSVISGHTLTQVLRCMLAFWNGVDLMYTALDKPKIYLNIAGIIIAGNNSTTPYIAKVVSTKPANANNVLSKMGRYFYGEQHRFPMNRYDIIIAMTGLDLYLPFDGIRHYKDGFKASNTTACYSAHKASKTKTITNTGIVRHDWKFYMVREAVEIIASLLGAKKDVFNLIVAECSYEGGNIIVNNKFCPADLKQQWSYSNRKDFSRYFSSSKSKCLRNKPRWIKQVGKVLPGRWLTLDGQCKNEGYATACKLKKFSTCAAKGCRAKRTGKCIRTKRRPLPGTRCKANKRTVYRTARKQRENLKLTWQGKRDGNIEDGFYGLKRSIFNI